MITEISQRRMTLLMDFTWRSRGLPWALQYQATDRDTYRIAYRMIKKLLLNGIPNWIPILVPGGLPNDYQEANGYSTEAAYRDGHREVDQEHTEVIIRMTFRKKRATDTLRNADSREAGICICKPPFRERKRTPIAVCMTTYCEVYMLDMDQWHTTHAWCNCRILPPSMVTSESHMRTDSNADARSESSHHCQSHDETALLWRRDWEDWDASYDSKSTGWTSHEA